MKKISMLMTVAAICISTMHADFMLPGRNGKTIWYASCIEILSRPEKFDGNSDRFYQAFEACSQNDKTPGVAESLEDLVHEERLKIAQNNPQLKDVDHLKLKPLVKRRVLCTGAAGYDEKIAGNSICTANEKKLQDFLNAVNGTNN